jgi:hypothetical protein
MSRQVISLDGGAVNITAAHSGCDVVVTGGQCQVVLPAPIADCDVRIINGDANSGKILVGFPSDVNPKLYPHQAVAINSDGTTWFAEEKPGRWKIPSGTIVYVHSDPNIGNDANDGLTPQTPLQHMSMAGSICQTDFDTNQTTPIIAPMAGSSFVNDELGLGGQPTGGNLIQLSPYGSGSIGKGDPWNDSPCQLMLSSALSPNRWSTAIQATVPNQVHTRAT